MKLLKQNELVVHLRRRGFVFSEFHLISEGNFHVNDAVWNYRDIAHVNIVHSQADQTVPIVGDRIVNAIIWQKLFGLEIPVVLTSYEPESNIHTNFFTLFSFIFISESRFEKIGSNRTRVTTEYRVGSKWLCKFLHPIFKLLLTRNYKILMETDAPMRKRRGELRSMGFSFLEENSLNFVDSLDLNKTNVIPPMPNDDQKSDRIDLNKVLPSNGEFLLGRDNHLGVQIIRDNQDILVFPRICLHSGASLDREKFFRDKLANNIPSHPCKKGDLLSCPWHGKEIHPIATFELNKSKEQIASTSFLSLILNDGILTVKEKT